LVQELNSSIRDPKAIATAIVIPARYGPRNRVAGRPTMRPATAPAAVQTSRSSPIEELWWFPQIANT